MEPIPISEVQFKQGAPKFPYKLVYPCFSGANKDLLYRLVADDRWAFYNNSNDTVLVVRATFGKDSQVKALSGTMLKQAGDNERLQAITSILPGCTELFVEGTINGFELEFISEAMEERSPHFENGTPSLPYNKIYRCFKQQQNGMLFRLVTLDKESSEQTWSFYNDTKQFNMEVEVTFEQPEHVRPLDETSVTTESEKGRACYKLVVPPLSTKPFAKGIMQNYSKSFVARPIGSARPDDAALPTFINGSPDTSVIAYPCTKVIRGFKNNGNGLVFVLVDENSHKWAVYNDTKDYRITVGAHFGPGAVYKPAKKVTVTEDPNVKGGTVCLIEVPPVTTELFITDGNPKDYRLSFSAEDADATTPEKNVSYENGRPDVNVMAEVDEVYKCFKDRGNGLMFRLVNKKRGQWAFYNDTKDATFTVKVTFEDSDSATPMGETKVVEDPAEGKVFLLDVPPLKTKLFACGKMSSYTMTFQGKRSATKVS
ncbi:hypothetical protein TRVL_03278 [Trypanosoma vivax]|nr:hypothetical protein TRVL_03278 [Trypanosoma vivax]